MKSIIVLIITGFLSVSFFGCAKQPIKKVHQKSMMKKERVQKSSKKRIFHHKKKKRVDVYHSTIDKNIAKSRAKKKRLAYLRDKKEKLLIKIGILNQNYAKSKNKKELNKKRVKISKELANVQKEYDTLKSTVVVTNYTQDKNSRYKD